jgi:hypothetical protein
MIGSADKAPPSCSSSSTFSSSSRTADYVLSVFRDRSNTPMSLRTNGPLVHDTQSNISYVADRHDIVRMDHSTGSICSLGKCHAQVTSLLLVPSAHRRIDDKDDDGGFLLATVGYGVSAVGVHGLRQKFDHSVTGSITRNPKGLAMDSRGRILYAMGHSIWRLDPQAEPVAGVLIAGALFEAGVVDSANALEARFSNPAALALDSEDNVYIADTDNDRVRRYDGRTGAVTTSLAATSKPRFLEMDASSDTLYVANDCRVDCVSVSHRESSPSSRFVTLAGDHAGYLGTVHGIALVRPRNLDVVEASLLAALCDMQNFAEWPPGLALLVVAYCRSGGATALLVSTTLARYSLMRLPLSS